MNYERVRFVGQKKKLHTKRLKGGKVRKTSNARISKVHCLNFKIPEIGKFLIDLKSVCSFGQGSKTATFDS